jgi:hypothetical protein
MKAYNQFKDSVSILFRKQDPSTGRGSNYLKTLALGENDICDILYVLDPLTGLYCTHLGLEWNPWSACIEMIFIF